MLYPLCHQKGRCPPWWHFSFNCTQSRYIKGCFCHHFLSTAALFEVDQPFPSPGLPVLPSFVTDSAPLQWYQLPDNTVPLHCIGLSGTYRPIWPGGSGRRSRCYGNLSQISPPQRRILGLRPSLGESSACTTWTSPPDAGGSVWGISPSSTAGA